MPYVASSNPKLLKLAGRVHLPPPTGKDEKGEPILAPVKVSKEQWAQCMADPLTRTFMARGIVKLCAAPTDAKSGGSSKTLVTTAPKKDDEKTSGKK